MFSLPHYPLPYHPDTARLFALWQPLEWSAWLDSGHRLGDPTPPLTALHRYDILVADPLATLTTDGHNQTTLWQQNPRPLRLEGSPLESARALLHAYADGVVIPPAEVPFNGGLLGYWGYELGQPQPSELPKMALGLYGWAVVVDHARQQSGLWVALPACYAAVTLTALQQQLTARLTTPTEPPATFYTTTPIQPQFDAAAYRHAFDRVQQALYEGECYQINLTQRYRVGYSGSLWSAYRALRQRQPAPFGGYFTTPATTVLSFSPERFLEIAQGRVTTMPIKGTRRRGKTAAEDAELARELQQSAKDRAENVMIVDLLRNDLGRHCRAGTVVVPALCELQSHPNVHHLVSTICGELAARSDPLDLLAAAFPGGSVTGAPKIRAMQIIHALEQQPRNLYCGALGYLSFNGRLDTNIAIRTAYRHGENLHFHAGGGIISDSDPDAEYAEMATKARFLTDYLTEVYHP